MSTGRHAMVVMTHKAEVKDLQSVKDKIHNETSIPQEKIWAFDNYTKNKTGEMSIKYGKDKNEGNQRQGTDEKPAAAASLRKGKYSKDEENDIPQREKDSENTNKAETEDKHGRKGVKDQMKEDDGEDTDEACDKDQSDATKVEETVKTEEEKQKHGGPTKEKKKGLMKMFKRESKDKKAQRDYESGNPGEEGEKLLQDHMKENEGRKEEISKDHEGGHQEIEAVKFENQTPDKSNMAKEDLEEPEKDGAASKGDTTHVHQGDSKGIEEEDQKGSQQEKGGNQQEGQQTECTVEESMGKHGDKKSKKKDKEKKKKDKKDEKKDKKKGRKGKESQENEVAEKEKMDSDIGIKSGEEPLIDPAEKVTETNDDRRENKDEKDPVLNTPENINELGHEEEQIQEDKANENLAAHNDCQMGTEEPGTSDRKEDEENELQESTVIKTEIEEDGKDKESKDSKKKEKEKKKKQKKKGDQETGATEKKRSALGKLFKTNKTKSEEIPQNIDIEGNKELVNGSEMESKDEHHIEVDPMRNVQEHDEHQREEAKDEEAPVPNTDIEEQGKEEEEALKRKQGEKTVSGDQIDTHPSEKALTDDKEDDKDKPKESQDGDTEDKELDKDKKPQNFQEEEEEEKEEKNEKQEDGETVSVREKKKEKNAWPLKVAFKMPGSKAKNNEEIKGKLHKQEDVDDRKEDSVLQQGSQQSPEMGAGHDDTVNDEETPNKDHQKSPRKLQLAEIGNIISNKFPKFRAGRHQKLQDNDEVIMEIADEVDEKKK